MGPYFRICPPRPQIKLGCECQKTVKITVTCPDDAITYDEISEVVGRYGFGPITGADPEFEYKIEDALNGVFSLTSVYNPTSYTITKCPGDCQKDPIDDVCRTATNAATLCEPSLYTKGVMWGIADGIFEYCEVEPGSTVTEPKSKWTVTYSAESCVADGIC